MRDKEPTVVVIVLCAWLGVAVLAVHSRLGGVRWDTVAMLSLVAACGWWIVLALALHHLGFHLLSLTRLGRPAATVTPPTADPLPNIAILYTTCDDFDTNACRSCVQQRYDGGKFRVFVLDDSTTADYQNRVRDFCEGAHPVPCKRVVRPHPRGFKAGNLNHALERHVSEDWVLIIDADDHLEPGFLHSLVAALPATDAGVAFVQAAHTARLSSYVSPVERLMALASPFYCLRHLPTRQRFGFVPMLGHGTMVSKAAWRDARGFPEIISEDVGFALRCANQRRRGICLSEPVAAELCPFDFGGFVIRLRRYAAGTADLIRKERYFWTGQAHAAEKWDALMQLAWYPLVPVIIFNGFLTAYALHKRSHTGASYLTLVLLLVYAAVFVTLVCRFVAMSGERRVGSLRFYLCSTAVYASAMPMAGISFVTYLVRDLQTFDVTPKNGERRALAVRDAVITVSLGCLTVAAAILWYSPFSPIVAGQGVAYLCYPLYGCLCEASLVGTAARLMLYPPGILMLVGIVSVVGGYYFQ